MSVFACALVLMGLCVLAYPYARDALIEAGQRKLMTQWCRSLTEEAADVPEESDGADKACASSAGGLPDTKDVIGILTIEAIDLEQPILRGATEQNLSSSVCAIEPGDTPGEVGNFVIAGHNSRAYGRNFNRLGELRPEDEITVILSDRTLQYRVDSVTVVASDAVDILSGDGSTARITLLTCYYRENGVVDRLAVCGKLVP